MGNHFTYYIYIPSIIISVILTIYIYFVDRKDSKNKTFSLITLSSCIWVTCLFLSDFIKSENGAFFWSQCAIIPPAFIPPLFVYFSTVFPKKLFVFKSFYLFILFLPAVAISSLAFTRFNVISVNQLDWGTQVDSGSLYYALGAYYVVAVIIAIYYLFQGYRKADMERYRSQVLYLTAGLMIAIIINVFINVVLVGLGNSKYSALGTASVLVFLGLTIFALVRKNLFNIKTLLINIAVVVAIGAVAIQSAMQIISSQNLIQTVIVCVTLLLVIYGGSLIIKSVKIEIAQREKLTILAKKLDDANVRLEELDEAKDNFLSMATHELNTPIAAINGYLSMIIDEKLTGEVNKETMGYLQQIFSSSKRLANLVKDLLNVSRIESNRVHIIYTQAQMEDVISHSIGEVAIKAKQVGHTLVFEPPAAKLPLTYLDVPRITEVIINIIGNAIKYTEPPGRIIVRAQADASKIVVSIQDNGRGIPPDKYNHIFEKFTQVNVLKDEVKGTGLGMFISKNLIEMHKGQIWFKSSVDPQDHGTTFFFSIPVLRQKPADPHEGEGALFALKQPAGNDNVKKLEKELATTLGENKNSSQLSVISNQKGQESGKVASSKSQAPSSPNIPQNVVAPGAPASAPARDSSMVK